MSAAASSAAVDGRGAAPSWVVAPALAITSIVVGLLAGEMAASGHASSVLALGGIALFVVLWKRPELSPIVVLTVAVTVEQFSFGGTTPGSTSPGVAPSDLTDRIPLFHGLAKGVHISPADLMLLAMLAIWLLKRGTSATVAVPRSPLTYCVGALVGAVVLGIVVGQAHHGSLRTAFTEVRPYVYLAVAYLVACVFTTRITVLRAAMWALVLGSGFKAAQAIHSFLAVRGQSPRPDFVVGHEEALFFALFILLTLSLWMYQVPGRLRATATTLLPLVLVADLVNSRRAAWLILGGALIVQTLVVWVTMPERRRFLTRVLVVLTLFSVVYFPLYWNHTGALAGPARAVHSAVAPNPRDESSDLYRVQENANLKHNIREGGVVGRGFGVPIDYVLPIADIRSIDPLIAYIPHNGVFYIFMRMGLLGALAFWSLLGVAIIGGCRLARSVNREIALFGTLIVCAVVGYALEGYNDQGFFMYRIAFVIGTVLGLGEAARRLSAVTPAVPLEAVASPIPAPVAARTPRARRQRTPVSSAGPAGVAERLRKDRVAQIVALVLLPVAVGFLLWLMLAGPKHTTTPIRTPVPAPAATSLPDIVQRNLPRQPAAVEQAATLVLANARRDSWVEVRRDSELGPVVFSGQIPTGGGISLRGARLWARFGAASNLDIVLNGKPIALQGTVNMLFTARGAQPQGVR